MQFEYVLNITHYFTSLVQTKAPFKVSTVLNAVSRPFPKTALMECVPHLAKSVYRKLCELGYEIRHHTDEKFNMRFKSFTALPFLCFTSNKSVPIEFVTNSKVTYIDAEWGPRHNWKTDHLWNVLSGKTHLVTFCQKI